MAQQRWLLGLAAAAALAATPLSAQQTFYYPAKGQSPEKMNNDRGSSSCTGACCVTPRVTKPAAG